MRRITTEHSGQVLQDFHVADTVTITIQGHEDSERLANALSACLPYVQEEVYEGPDQEGAQQVLDEAERALGRELDSD